MRRGFSLIFFFLISLTMLSQTYWQEKVYSPLIKSVKFELEGVDFSLPVIRLGTDDKLILRFDDLVENTQRYNYTIIHCNYDWTQSELTPQEYIEGFESGYIENHSNSVNTIQRYLHYWQEFPSSMMRFLVSGNYIVKVYADDNTDKVVMVRRFMVVEDGANIRANPIMSRSPQTQRTMQEVDVFVSPTSNISFADPNRFLKVVVLQNQRRDNASLLKLRQYRANELEYSFDNANLFEAGNEFRNFDFTSLRTRSQTVSNFDYVDEQNVVILRPIINRKNIAYTTIGDLNGNYYVRSERANNFNLESDYAWVNFYLNTPVSLESDYYVWGELSDWYCNNQNKMTYNPTYRAYTAKLYLKQGFYNYMIMSSEKNNPSSFNLNEMEGNFSESNNSYNIFVYYRQPGYRYDSLIGYSKVDINK